MQLITGGMGFIGLHTARTFLDAGERVVVTRYRTERRPLFLEGEWDNRLFAEPLDLTDERAVIGIVERHQVNGIVHLVVPALADAAQPTLSEAEEFQVNMMGLNNILNATRVGGVKRLAIASSVSVYAASRKGRSQRTWRCRSPPAIPRRHLRKASKSWPVITPTGPESTSYFLRIGGVYCPFTTAFQPAFAPSTCRHAGGARSIGAEAPSLSPRR